MPSPRAERLARRVWALAPLTLLRFVGCDVGEVGRAPRGEPAPVEAGDGTTNVDEPAPSSASSPPPPAELVPAQLAVVSASRCPAGTVLVEGGTLSTLERGPEVKVEAFCLDVHEVSVAELRACVREGRCDRVCPPGASCPELPARTDWKIPGEDDVVSGFCNGAREGREDHPVNCVSFEEAMGYCAAHGKRLPTGDEWEWASKSGAERRASPWGGAVASDEICWGRPNKRAGTCKRGSHPKDTTAQGAKAMGGSLSEWVSAPARARSAKAVSSGARWAYGASWYAIDDGYARAALGGVQMPARRAETVGFRCAL